MGRFYRPEGRKIERSLSVANPENLKPFVKGDPRRINKPKGAVHISTEIKKILGYSLKASDIDGVEKKMPIGRLVALAAIKQALKGDLRGIEILLERMEGKVPSEMKLGGMDDNPLGIEVHIKSDQVKN